MCDNRPMSTSFQRRVENFDCNKCGVHVKGCGFTNHCPVCLWSQHVDEYPGDRAATCGGMMEPITLEGGVGDYKIVHRCTACGYEKRNKLAQDDDMGAALRIATARGVS